jgi:DNA-directed RNA polymerase subunit M/transcription elongation factor TFIIS
MSEDFHLTKPCPMCNAEMHKDCDADEINIWWQCQNCEHREDLQGNAIEHLSLTREYLASGQVWGP